MAYVTYKPAQVRNSSGKMFVQFSLRNPITNQWVRVKKYGIGQNMGLNRIRDLDERARLAEQICKAYNQLFAEGYVPPEFRLDNKTQTKERNWTLFQALNMWKLNSENRFDRKKTIATYGCLINHFLRKFKGLHAPIKEITKSDLELFLLSVKRNSLLSNTSYNNYLKITKLFFNYCLSGGLIEKSPADKLKYIKAVVTKYKSFDDQTLGKIKQHAPKPLLEFLEFLYETGIRPGEARHLQFKHVTGEMLLVPGVVSKNRKDEYVPLSTEFAKKLVGPPDDYIFGGKQPVGLNYYGSLFKKLRELLQLDDKHCLYSIKHTRALHLVRDKVDPYSIMRLFRHSSLEITMLYLRELGTQVNREAVEKGRAF